MNCTRVLNAIGGHPQPAVMPVDLAMCLSLNRLLSTPTVKPVNPHRQPTSGPTRMSLRYPHYTLSTRYPLSSLLLPFPVSSGPRSCFHREGTVPIRKHVVFADAMGLPLIAVRLFVPEPSSPDSTFVMKPSPAQQSNKLCNYKLRLGFPPPTLNFKDFLTRLRDNYVQLESCNISGNTLIGKVCASHVSRENTVHIRATFDSWRSQYVIPCTFVKRLSFGIHDMDVFEFDISLPKNLDPKERVEFYLYFLPGHGSTPRWDDNMGQNYQIYMEKDGSNSGQSIANRFFPALLHHPPPLTRPPRWSPSMQNSAERQTLRSKLSSSQSRGEKLTKVKPVTISQDSTAVRCK